MAGFAFTCFEFKGKKIFYPLVLISFMVPFEAIAIPLYNVANGLGMVDTYAGMIVPAIADGLVTFLFIQFFKDIPPSLVEVARADGAKCMTIFIKVIIPISIPVFVTAGLFKDFYESVEFLYVASSGSTIQGDQNHSDRDQPVQRENVPIQWTYIYASSDLSHYSNLLVPSIPEVLYGSITAGSVKDDREDSMKKNFGHWKLNLDMTVQVWTIHLWWGRRSSAIKWR